MQLLSRPQPHIGNLVIFHLDLGGEPPYQIDNLDRLSHIEHADSRSLYKTRLEDEFDRLGHRHEVTTHFWIGDGNARLGSQLLIEQRENATRRPEDITKAYHPVAATERGVLHQLLGRSHDVGG